VEPIMTREFHLPPTRHARRWTSCRFVAIALITFATVVPERAWAQTAGVRCVALPLPTLRGADGSATELAGGLRDLVSSFLKGPSLRTVPLEARLADQAMEEAREQGCPTVLTITLSRKKGGSGGGLGRLLSGAAGAAAWHLPYGGSMAKSTAVRSAAIAGTAAASTLATNTTAKDELQIEYRLSSAAGDMLREGKEGAKAKADGEDLVTPLVERMAGVVAAALPR
jgi:hypothetical protein